MLKESILKSTVLVSALMTSAANAIVIDFEAFSTGNLSNVETFSGVEFSVIDPTSTTGLRIFNGNDAKTAYLLSCEFALPSPCVKDLNVDFGASVSNVSFDFLAEDLGPGSTSGRVDAYLSGGLVGSMDLISNGNIVPNLIDLSALGFIDQLVITSAPDPAGLGYDNFSFSAVPLPAAAWLFASGLLGLAAFARRKQVN